MATSHEDCNLFEVSKIVVRPEDVDFLDFQCSMWP